MPCQGNLGQRKILNRKGKENIKARVIVIPKGRATEHFRRKKDLDYEHAGVAIAIHPRWLKHLEEIKEVSGRIIVLKFKGAGGTSRFSALMRLWQTAKGRIKTTFMILWQKQ